jgi:hypothetical protein
LESVGDCLVIFPGFAVRVAAAAAGRAFDVLRRGVARGGSWTRWGVFRS